MTTPLDIQAERARRGDLRREQWSPFITGAITGTLFFGYDALGGVVRPISEPVALVALVFNLSMIAYVLIMVGITAALRDSRVGRLHREAATTRHLIRYVYHALFGCGVSALSCLLIDGVESTWWISVWLTVNLIGAGTVGRVLQVVLDMWKAALYEPPHER